MCMFKPPKPPEVDTPEEAREKRDSSAAAVQQAAVKKTKSSTAGNTGIGTTLLLGDSFNSVKF